MNELQLDLLTRVILRNKYNKKVPENINGIIHKLQEQTKLNTLFRVYMW